MGRIFQAHYVIMKNKQNTLVVLGEKLPTPLQQRDDVMLSIKIMLKAVIQISLCIDTMSFKIIHYTVYCRIAWLVTASWLETAPQTLKMYPAFFFCFDFQ